MFERLEELAEMRRELDAAEAAWLEVVAAYDRSGDWRADGYLNAASAIRNACRMSEGVARGYLELARKLEALPVLADTFGRGEISAGTRPSSRTRTRPDASPRSRTSKPNSWSSHASRHRTSSASPCDA